MTIQRHTGLRDKNKKYLLRKAREAGSAVCPLCGFDIDLDPDLPGMDPNAPSLDHIVPVVAGGSQELHNCQLVHLGCNKLAGDKGTRRQRPRNLEDSGSNDPWTRGILHSGSLTIPGCSCPGCSCPGCG